MIQIEDYSEEWPLKFDELKSEIWPAVADLAVSLEHVGSTSVVGLAAKPVIDLDLIIADASKLPQVATRLKQIGYIHQGNLGIEDRESFKKENPKFKHNFYVCIQNCTALKNHLVLRDALRKSSKLVKQYSELKKELAKKFPDHIDQYVEGKTAFILSILAANGFSDQESSAIAEVNKAPVTPQAE